MINRSGKQNKISRNRTAHVCADFWQRHKGISQITDFWQRHKGI